MKNKVAFFVSLFWLLLVSLQLNAQQIKYVTSELNLRHGPGVNFGVIDIIPEGSSVELLDVSNKTWYFVDYNGERGYLNSRYLTSYILPQEPIKHYKNKQGNIVQSPTKYNTAPIGATAKCRDGSYSFSQTKRGTCSHHGGVEYWID
jgi:uncharacterized protein YgiM (DUF1202 family)